MEIKVRLGDLELGDNRMVVRSLTALLTYLLLSSSSYADPIIPAVYMVNVGSSLFGNASQTGSSTVHESLGTAIPFHPLLASP
jgi:hypothetical protein